MKYKRRADTAAVSLSGFSRSRREALHTTLWLVPSTMMMTAIALFAVTYRVDWSAVRGRITFPNWVNAGGADVARQTLIAIAAAVITVAGVAFSITILALQLASQQFGPRMLRLFIRDIGTQLSIGAFVATVVYSVLALGSVQSSPAPVFVPHLSVSAALGLALVDLGALIYFIHHVAVSIQLTTVVSSIARDFRLTLAAIQADASQLRVAPDGPTGPPPSGADTAPCMPVRAASCKRSATGSSCGSPRQPGL